MLDRVVVDKLAELWGPHLPPDRLDALCRCVDDVCTHTGVSPWQLVSVGYWLLSAVHAHGTDDARAHVAAAAIRTIEGNYQ